MLSPKRASAKMEDQHFEVDELVDEVLIESPLVSLRRCVSGKATMNKGSSKGTISAKHLSDLVTKKHSHVSSKNRGTAQWSMKKAAIISFVFVCKSGD